MRDGSACVQGSQQQTRASCLTPLCLLHCHCQAVWEEQMRAMTKEQLEPQGSEDEDETEGEDEESLGGFIVEDEVRI